MPRRPAVNGTDPDWRRPLRSPHRLATAVGWLVALALIIAASAGHAAHPPYIVAGITWPGGKAQFFLSDGTYVRYDIAADRADPGYPRAIDDGSWQGLGPYARDITAACQGPKDKVYFFLATGQYLRYDVRQDRVDPGYPKPINNVTWPGLEPYASQIMAAFNWKGGKIQFLLNDGQYIRYDVAADRVDDGYPKAITAGNWPGLAPYAGKITGLINWVNDKAYVFLDTGEYLRYDINSDRMDASYPKTIDDTTWPGLGWLFPTFHR